jgi:CBS domain containing-hemolysin-like protein
MTSTGPMLVSTLLWISVVLLLVAFNAFFVATEFSLVSIRWVRLIQQTSGDNVTASLGGGQGEKDRARTPAQTSRATK